MSEEIQERFNELSHDKALEVIRQYMVAHKLLLAVDLFGGSGVSLEPQYVHHFTPAPFAGVKIKTCDKCNDLSCTSHPAHGKGLN